MNEKKCLASHFQLLDKSKYIMQFDINMNVYEYEYIWIYEYIYMNEGYITLEIS